MKKPKPSVFKTPENTENYYKALKAYEYWKDCNRINRGLKPKTTKTKIK